MVKLFTVSEMISLEKEANEKGLTFESMMANAGKGIADEIENQYQNLDEKKVLALVGSGNNGGDALVALTHLVNNNWEAYAYIIRKRDRDDHLLERFSIQGGQIIQIDSDSRYTRLKELLASSSVLVDGILGTGIKLPLRGDLSKVLRFIKEYLESHNKKLHVVAVDCPSGVDCDTGEVADEVIPAEITITMAGIKQGLFRFPAAGICGDIRIASIGSIDNLDTYKINKKIIITEDLIRHFMPKRTDNTHKGSFGTTYIIAGSVNYTGAAFLAGLAAYRIGTGLVTIAVPTPLHASLSGKLPESTWVILPDELGVISADAALIARQNIERATSILIGPGFGLEETTKEFIKRFFTIRVEISKGKIGFIRNEDIRSTNERIKIPVIIDADGLKLLSKIDNWPQLIPTPAILTPHPGELSIMTGLPVSEIQQNRIEIAKQYSQQWGQIIILKGAYTVIANPEGDIALVPVATSALAKAGTGDVLSGIIAGLLAQGVQPFQAACTGAWIHANAGLKAAKQIGNTTSVIASDVLNAIPQVINDLNKK